MGSYRSRLPEQILPSLTELVAQTIGSNRFSCQTSGWIWLTDDTTAKHTKRFPRGSGVDPLTAWPPQVEWRKFHLHSWCAFRLVHYSCGHGRMWSSVFKVWVVGTCARKVYVARQRVARRGSPWSLDSLYSRCNATSKIPTIITWCRYPRSTLSYNVCKSRYPSCTSVVDVLYSPRQTMSILR